MPYNPLADNTELTAAHLLAEVYNQVISQVTSASRPGSPAAGQMIYETDTGLYQAWNGSGWVPFGGLGGWTSYTPTVTQSGAVTKTVTYARSIKIGRLVIVCTSMAITGAGSGNAAVTVSLPYTAASVGVGNMIVGSGGIFETGVGTFPGLAVLNTTTTIAFLDSAIPTTGVLLGQTGSSWTSAFASGDALGFTAMYEAAA